MRTSDVALGCCSERTYGSTGACVYMCASSQFISHTPFKTLTYLCDVFRHEHVGSWVRASALTGLGHAGSCLGTAKRSVRTLSKNEGHVACRAANTLGMHFLIDIEHVLDNRNTVKLDWHGVRPRRGQKDSILLLGQHLDDDRCSSQSTRTCIRKGRA